MAVAVTLAFAQSVTEALNAYGDSVVAAAPQVLAGLTFLLVAGAAVRVVTWLVGRVLVRALPGQSPVYRQFVRTVVAAFLWFGVLLAFLSIVGLEGIALSLGTATGFVALGVSYAVSDMLEDVVAGVYLLRDPDFSAGDLVTTAGYTGEVRAIELRKTRLLVEGDLIVLRNGDIEGEWRLEKRGEAPDLATDPVTADGETPAADDEPATEA